MRSGTHKHTAYWVWSCYLLVTLLIVFSLDNFFYWDTVQLGSKHAHFFYDSNFSSLLLPDGIDSGHIPAFGIYIGLLWKFFGKTLWISHLAMLPFALGIVYQLKNLVEYFLPPKYVGPALVLVLIDATLLAQLVLVSPDVPLVFFFLLSFNAILKNNKRLLALGIVALFLISMRGMMLSVCLLLLDLYCNVPFRRRHKVFIDLVKRSLIYLPALLIFLAFSIYHYDAKGWIGFHSDSPWAGSFERVGVKGFFFNIAILGWRLLDFGRIGVWLVAAIIFSLAGRAIFKDSKTRLLLYFSIALLALLPLNMLWAKGLLGHRYLLPIFLTIALLCVRLLFSEHVLKKNREPLAYLLFFIMLSGHFWIYPPKVAQGWDASLAHYPYYKLRTEAMAYMMQNDIEIEETASFFPNKGTLSAIDLVDDERHFLHFDGKQPYVFYSNSYNVSDENLNLLNEKYLPIQQFESGDIYIVIYKRY